MCKSLKHLDLGNNSLGETGLHLSETILLWGNDPPLKFFGLINCSMDTHLFTNVLQSLSSCRHLTELMLSNNTLSEAGYDLAHCIRSWGDNPPLQQLYLFKCLIPEQTCAKLLQSVSSCRCLTHLSLGRNTLGLAGQYLTQYIKSQIECQLQVLLLKDCSMPVHIWSGLFEALLLCMELKVLDVSENTLDDSGRKLAQAIRSWGDSPKLEALYLGKCVMQVDVWNDVLQSLSLCRNLNEFDAPKEVLDKAQFLPEFVAFKSDNLQAIDSLLEYRPLMVGISSIKYFQLAFRFSLPCRSLYQKMIVQSNIDLISASGTKEKTWCYAAFSSQTCKR